MKSILYEQFNAEEIQRELIKLDAELRVRFTGPRYTTDQKDRVLSECVAELRLRVAQLEAVIHKMSQD